MTSLPLLECFFAIALATRPAAAPATGPVSHGSPTARLAGASTARPAGTPTVRPIGAATPILRRVSMRQSVAGFERSPAMLPVREYDPDPLPAGEVFPAANAVEELPAEADANIRPVPIGDPEPLLVREPARVREVAPRPDEMLSPRDLVRLRAQRETQLRRARIAQRKRQGRGPSMPRTADLPTVPVRTSQLTGHGYAARRHAILNGGVGWWLYGNPTVPQR